MTMDLEKIMNKDIVKYLKEYLNVQVSHVTCIGCFKYVDIKNEIEATAKVYELNEKNRKKFCVVGGIGKSSLCYIYDASDFSDCETVAKFHIYKCASELVSKEYIKKIEKWLEIPEKLKIRKN